jgi:DNA-binding NarL/FixJ family response regulator
MYNLTTQLTTRETQLMRLLAQGQSPEAIARAVGRHPNTVWEALATLAARLWCADRAALQRYARQWLGAASPPEARLKPADTPTA